MKEIQSMKSLILSKEQVSDFSGFIIIIIIIILFLFFCARKHEACRLKIDGAMELCEWSDPYVD